MPHNIHNTELALSNQPVIIQPSEGEMLQAGGVSCQFKVTSSMSGDQLGLYQIVLQPNTPGARLHFHKSTDEVFIVLKGTLTIQSLGTTYQAAEGTVIQVPRLTPHGFCNNSSAETKILLVFNPGHKREGFFRELFHTIRTETLGGAAFKDVNHRYDTFPLTNDNNNKKNKHEQVQNRN
jgi:quercetin dioxygenase-like cupin family protein